MGMQIELKRWGMIELERRLGETEVGFDNADILEDLVGFFGSDTRMDDNIVALLPVPRGSDTVLVTQLQGVDDTEDFIKVATGGGRIAEDETDGLFGVNDEDRAHGEGNALGIDIGSVLMVQHVVEFGHLAVSISNDGEVELHAVHFVDVFNPLGMILQSIGGKPNHLHATLFPFVFESCYQPEFRCAHGG